MLASALIGLHGEDNPRHIAWEWWVGHAKAGHARAPSLLTTKGTRTLKKQVDMCAHMSHVSVGRAH